MLESFTPPGIESMSEIDIAEGVSYDGESVVIQGVVSPRGQGATFRDKGKCQVHQFHLAAWHRPGEAIRRDDLLILRPLPPDVDNYFGDFPAYSIQRFRVLISADGERSVLEQVLQVEEPVDELYAIADELGKPVVVSTDRFGDLVLNSGINWFEGETEWNGTAVDVKFPAEKEHPLKESLETAEKLWMNQQNWTKLVEDAAVGDLLETKNEAWLEEGENEITSSEFLARMRLTSISISRDGDFEFSFDDGDLFWGHLISVRGNVNGDMIDVGLHG